MHYLPGKLILLDIMHGVFNCFVHQCINTGDEKVNCTKQRFSVFGQKLLGVSVVAKLLLKNKCHNLFRFASVSIELKHDETNA